MSAETLAPRAVAARMGRRAGDLLDRATGRRYGLYGLAVLRIGYGLALIGILLVNYGDRRLLWGPESPWTGDLFTGTLADRGSFSLYALLSSGLWFEVLYHATIVAAAVFAAGWRTRWVTPVLLVLLWSWHERNPLLVDGGDTLMQLVLIYLCFADLSARWSVDARRRAGREEDRGRLRWRVLTVLHNTAVLATLAQMCLVYVTAGMLKVQGERWQDGTALYYALRIAEFQPFPALSRLFYDHEFLVVTSGYLAVFVQLLFPALMLNTVTRRLGLVAVMGMHVGVGVLMGLPFMSFIMIVTDLLFVRDSTYARVAGLVTAAVRSRRAAPPAPGPVRPERNGHGAAEPEWTGSVT
ncbi:hypothetical protein Misp01_78610 [Microtetraspora sp. NBRC 13810]|uniref:HTTM domain-containing protein n=1 Tax=Microtetraspora sp. NBRC 13810 TaxID=3030990 RepID=UPI0024A3380D|nr:HTTM domain-containing protein [Microtetraspora sp. NBRC 13810]GLW12733.1 hypothetical protein Misp01_78610 [Microtetraspora sp. NBRC 13810]